jgi:ABC-type transport system substrate-binding protein
MEVVVVTQRACRTLAALAVGGALFAGMGSTAIASTSPAGANPAQASGSTFVVANVSSVQKLDPDVVTNFLDFQALGLIYDQLVQLNANLQVVPDLSTSWSFGPGNRSITFKLRTGEPPGHFDPLRIDLGQPFDAVDQGHCRRDAGQKARWHRPLRLL